MSTLYGPNSSDIEHFLGRLAQLSLERLGDAVHAWRVELAKSSAWHTAEDAVSRAIAETARHRPQWLILERLFNTFREAPWFKAGQPGSLIPGSDAAAQYVATAALLALLVRDVLAPAAFQTLYSPFQSIIPASQPTAPIDRGLSDAD
jgi:hypothetical protein